MRPPSKVRFALPAALVVLAACTGQAGGSPGLSQAPTPSRTPAPSEAPAEPAGGAIAARACKLPHSLLLRQWRGYSPGRSPDIIMLPYAPNYMGSGYPHVGPWNYISRVPFFIYGPGYVRPAGVIKRNITIVNWAPTSAELLGFHHRWPAGHALSDALVPAAQRPVPPRLIFTLVWDAGGRDVLSQWPKAWPRVKALIPKGAWYDNAVIGSAPVSTAQDHPTLGTGAYPQDHGIVGNHLRIGNHVQEPYEDGPNLLKLPTLADLYDRAMGNRPKVGIIASSPWHLGMMGHGSYTPGGDEDIAMLHLAISTEWALPREFRPYYATVDYLNDSPPLSHYFGYADAIDGRRDGLWRGHDIAHENRGFNTPARIPYQTRAIENLIRHERFGKDDVPDLFFTNYKLIDEISHIETMNSLEMRDAVKADDAYIPKLIGFLNAWVGRGKWVMLLTADHGAMPNPAVTGAYRGSLAALKAAMNQVFDDDGDDRNLILNVQPTHIFINLPELEDNGYTLAQISEYVQKLTQSQLSASDSIIKPGHGDDQVFQAVFPSRIMRTLPCLPEARSG